MNFSLSSPVASLKTRAGLTLVCGLPELQAFLKRSEYTSVRGAEDRLSIFQQVENLETLKLSSCQPQAGGNPKFTYHFATIGATVSNGRRRQKSLSETEDGFSPFLPFTSKIQNWLSFVEGAVMKLNNFYRR